MRYSRGQLGELTGAAGAHHEATPERDLERLDEERQGSLGESASDTL